MIHEPRPYQCYAMDAIEDGEAAGLRRMLITSATGTGKTSLASWIIGNYLGQESLRDVKRGPALFIAHREELIDQARARIMELCDMSLFEVGVEQGFRDCPKTCQVIVGSIQTLKNVQKRLGTWRPGLIFIDEAHHYESAEWKKTLAEIGAFNGETLVVGLTATAKRGDKKSIYAYGPDGTPNLESPEDRENCVFEKLVYDYSILDAITDGWLAPVRGYRVQTETDISGVKTLAGDFNQKQLQQEVDNAARTSLAIEKWQEVAGNRQTIVFCAGVAHAHHAAEMWRERGYSAEAVDGETEKNERRAILQRFKTGQTQILCNDAVLTEGFDSPSCACIVCLKPTKSWPVYVQQVGRGLRPLAGIVDGLETSESRLAAIAASQKPDCILLDVVDITRDKNLCSAPSILDLPPDIDLEGHSLIETKELLAKYEERKERILSERPKTFSELRGVLESVDLLSAAAPKSAGDWRVTEQGFVYNHSQVGSGRDARLLREADGFRLKMTEDGKEIRNIPIKTKDVKTVFDAARNTIASVWKDSAPQKPRNLGTWDKLTPGRQRCLLANGHNAIEIDFWTKEKALGKVDQYMVAFNARKAKQARQEAVSAPSGSFAA